MKAQLFSLDLMVALTIFLGIITLAAYFIMIAPTAVTTYNDMQMQANEVANQLISTELGTEGTLSCERLMEMSNMSYEELRRTLGAGEYDLYVEIPNVTPSVCPGIRRNIDVMLIDDCSGSMGWTVAGQTIPPASPPARIDYSKNATKAFMTFLNESYDQAGLVFYSTAATLNATLNATTYEVKRNYNTTTDKMTAEGSTDIAGGLTNGTRELISARGRANATKVIIILSDGQPNLCYGLYKAGAENYPFGRGCALREADRAAANGITVYPIGFGKEGPNTNYLNRTFLEAIASKTGGIYYNTTTGAGLMQIYTEIALRVLSGAKFGINIGSSEAGDVASVVRVVQINRGEYSMIVKVYRKA